MLARLTVSRSLSVPKFNISITGMVLVRTLLDVWRSRTKNRSPMCARDARRLIIRFPETRRNPVASRRRYNSKIRRIKVLSVTPKPTLPAIVRRHWAALRPEIYRTYAPHRFNANVTYLHIPRVFLGESTITAHTHTSASELIIINTNLLHTYIYIYISVSK